MTLAQAHDPPSLPRSGGPVLAVLPLVTPPGNEDLAFLAQGLHEDICGALSRFRSLTVIAPMSSAAVATLPEPEIVRRLGASHIFRARLTAPAPERVQIRFNLTAGGAQLMADRIETQRALDLQDPIVARIAGSLAARIDQAELAEAQGRPPEGLEAYKLTLRGMAVLRRGDLDGDREARALFEQALALDPRSARARAGIALSHFNYWSCQFWDRAEQAGRLAYLKGHEALAYDEHDGLLHLIIGKVHLMRRDWERAEWYFDRALELSPHDAEVLIQLALCLPYLGHAEAAVEHAQRAMAINPFHPSSWHTYLGFAQLLARELEAAADSHARSDGYPYVDAPVGWAVALAYLGRLDEAERELGAFHANFREKILFGERDPEPGEAVRWFAEFNQFRRQEDLDFCLEGLRRVGARPAVPAAPAPALMEEGTLVRHGRGWRVVFAGTEAHLGALKGLEDVHRLLAHPHEETHCLDLADRAEETFAGDVTLDARGRAEIKARIRDLQEELAEAEDMNDIGRAERLRGELDALVHSLSRALGLGGRDRRLGNLAEKARTSVTWRIRHAIRQSAAAHPEFSRHLQHSVRTGTFCSYAPERPVTWRLDR